MPRRLFSDLVQDIKSDPERRERLAQFRRAIDDALAISEVLSQVELEVDTSNTQRDVAESLAVSQANISRIEHEEDDYLSTLREYVSALGGKLEINAVFPDRTVALVAGKPVRR
jgi:hypothetical protein